MMPPKIFLTHPLFLMLKRSLLLVHQVRIKDPLPQQIESGYTSVGVDLKYIKAREDKGRERIPHTWASYDENYLKTIFGPVWLF